MENTADNNIREAFSVEHSNGNSLVANTASNSREGFQLVNSAANEVKSNVATGNTFAGFLIDTGSTENVVKANVATGNRDGFTIDDAFDNTLKGNTANRQHAVRLFHLRGLGQPVEGKRSVQQPCPRRGPV